MSKYKAEAMCITSLAVRIRRCSCVIIEMTPALAIKAEHAHLRTHCDCCRWRVSGGVSQRV